MAIRIAMSPAANRFRMMKILKVLCSMRDIRLDRKWEKELTE